MKRLLEFINEALLFEEEEGKEKKSTAEMQEKILELLNKKEGDLGNFVKRLNKILTVASKKDNTKEWLIALKKLFDGKLKNIKADVDKVDLKGPKYTSISVSKLFPTQSEIDLENSIKHWVTNPAQLPNIWKDKEFGKNFGVPILVYNDGGDKYYIIDGHHRWSQVALLNPEGSVYCMLMKGDLNPLKFLELTQASIAAVIANPENQNNGVGGNFNLKRGKAIEENNIFGKALKDDTKFKEKIKEIVKSKNGNEEEIVKNIPDEAKDDKKDFSFDDLLDLMAKNRQKMLDNGQVPPKNAAPRPAMPQSDSASPGGVDDSKNAGPKKKGTALSYIAKGNFPKIGNN